MPRSISELVADNFSRDPGYYDRAAVVQGKAAARLAEMTRSVYGNAPPPGRVLEVGCGTGFLTRRLFSLFPEARFKVTDISPAMLGFCHHATEELRKNAGIDAEFALDDISSSNLEGNFDLVASSFTFQWAGALAELLPPLKKLTRSGGILCFATLGEGTFRSVRKRFAEFKVPFPMPYMVSDGDLDAALAGFSIRGQWRGEFREEYPALLDFLRHIRRIGSVNATGKRVDAGALKRIVSAKDRAGSVVAEYDVIMVVCEV